MDNNDTSAAVFALRDVSTLDHLDELLVVKHGPGAIDCSDLKTQLFIKEIVPLIKQYIVKSGVRFKICRGNETSKGDTVYNSIRNYWEAPSRMIRSRLENGEKIEMEDLMKIQVEEWCQGHEIE